MLYGGGNGELAMEHFQTTEQEIIHTSLNIGANKGDSTKR